MHLAIPRRDLMLVSEARKFLAEAVSIDTVKDVIDKAEAVRMYCKKAGEGLEAQNAAAEVRLLAIRRAGELLREIGGSGRPKKNSHDERFSDIGINYSQSSRWQAIASLDESAFEEYIASTKGDGKEITASGALSLARKQQASSDQAPKNEEWGAFDCLRELNAALERVYRKWPSDELPCLVAKLRAVADRIEVGTFHGGDLGNDVE